jgi:hypothetical protein
MGGVSQYFDSYSLVAHELNVEQFWRGCFGARRGARSEYSGSYINVEQQSMAIKETAKKVKDLVREPLAKTFRHDYSRNTDDFLYKQVSRSIRTFKQTLYEKTK